MGHFRDNDPTIQMERNMVKNWPEANQLAIYKRGQGFELGTTENKSSKWSVLNLNTGPPDYKSSTLTALPRCLHQKKKISRKRETECSKSTCFLNQDNLCSQGILLYFSVLTGQDSLLLNWERSYITSVRGATCWGPARHLKFRY